MGQRTEWHREGGREGCKTLEGGKREGRGWRKEDKVLERGREGCISYRREDKRLRKGMKKGRQDNRKKIGRMY